MEQESGFYQRVVVRLKEREKELKCLYRIEEVLRNTKRSVDELIQGVIEVMPSGWQHTTLLEVRIIFEGKVFHSKGFRETKWTQEADIVLDQNVAGRIDVVYTHNVEKLGIGIFLPEEQKLLNTIAESLGHHIFLRRLRATIDTFREEASVSTIEHKEPLLSPESDIHWKWRTRQAEIIAEHMDMDRFKVKAIYLIGSSKNANAGPASDIDLLIHHQAEEQELDCLKAWLEGWSLSLSEIGFLNTGHRTEGGLLDVHFLTDSDIRKKTSFAVMIGSIENSARLLRERQTD